MTAAEIRAIVADAASLGERLRSAAVPAGSVSSTEEPIAARLERWQAAVASSEALEKRLAWDGVDLGRAYLALSPHPPDPKAPLPAWARTIERIAGQRHGRPASRDTGRRDDRQPLPFEELARPALEAARQLLDERLSRPAAAAARRGRGLLLPNATSGLEEWLLRRLVGVAEPALAREFTSVQSPDQVIRARFLGPTAGAGSRAGYDRFVDGLLGDNLVSLFTRYPVLARLEATLVDLWLDAVTDLLGRLSSDLAVIARVAGAREPMGAVAEIESGLSDPHCRGRGVAVLTFESGVRAVYKPRDIAAEAAFNDLLEWCNRRGAPERLRVLKVWKGQGYGWVEHAEHRPCARPQDVARFFRRAGALVAVLDVLRAADCHCENLVASGADLVLVDAEALLYPAPRPADLPAGAEARADVDEFRDSVLRTGLLPGWHYRDGFGAPIDVTALGGYGQADQPRVPSVRWEFVNTDDMHLAPCDAEPPSARNVPTLDGRPVSPHEHVDEFVSGFEDTYRFLSANRGDLAGASGPLAPFRGQAHRFLVRPTYLYKQVQRASLDPAFLRAGVDRSIALEVLGRAFLDLPSRPGCWPIVGLEIDALERMDVPYFEAAADRPDLLVGRETVSPGYFVESAWDQMMARLARLGDADLARQAFLVRGAFQAREARNDPVRSTPADGAEPTPAGRPIDRQELVAEAERIAGEIAAAAFRQADGSVNWIGVEEIGHTGRYQLQPLGFSLYDGRAGVAVFLAAAANAGGSDRVAELALETLRPFREFVRAKGAGAPEQRPSDYAIGGARGLGSIVYALVKVHQFLGDGEALADAEQIAAWITDERIAADRALDVISGSAGAILGLVELHRVTGSAEVLGRAEACGRHLLEARADDVPAGRPWRAVAARPLTGFSHGAAGIAAALSRLYQASGDREYLSGAVAGIAYERACFSPSAANWPDFRDEAVEDGDVRFACSWCHGAPGVAIGRAALLGVADDDELRNEIRTAVDTTLRYSQDGVDHLCCGNMGRIEAVLVAAARLNQPAWAECAASQAARVVSRARRAGAYLLLPNLPASGSYPGLFFGTAGIGYELLRLAGPDRFPSLLSWQ
jgi:type 2 lantibiotic biosynthesis protein LanM